jgi:hypothetical protein
LFVDDVTGAAHTQGMYPSEFATSGGAQGNSEFSADPPPAQPVPLIDHDFGAPSTNVGVYSDVTCPNPGQDIPLPS